MAIGNLPGIDVSAILISNSTTENASQIVKQTKFSPQEEVAHADQNITNMMVLTVQDALQDLIMMFQVTIVFVNGDLSCKTTNVYQKINIDCYKPLNNEQILNEYKIIN